MTITRQDFTWDPHCDLLLDLRQAQRLLLANLALQDDNRHTGICLQKGGQPIHGTALTQLDERLISVA